MFEVYKWRTQDRYKEVQKRRYGNLLICVFFWFLLCCKYFCDEITGRWSCVNLWSVLGLIMWQAFFSFLVGRDVTDKRKQLMHHLFHIIVVNFTENMVFYIPKATNPRTLTFGSAYIITSSDINQLYFTEQYILWLLSWIEFSMSERPW